MGKIWFYCEFISNSSPPSLQPLTEKSFSTSSLCPLNVFKDFNAIGQEQRSFAALQDILSLDDLHSNIKSLNYRSKSNTDQDYEDNNYSNDNSNNINNSQ